MRPKTISASSLANAQSCLAKYKAVNFDYVPDYGDKAPAKEGTAVHYALQYFVQKVFMERNADWDDVELLRELYIEGYTVTFGTCDLDTYWFRDGWDLIVKWHMRTDLSDVTVLSVEEKRRTPVPSARYDKNKPAHQQNGAAVVPLTYIWDRCDEYVDPAGRRVVRVVDYKTERKFLRVDAVKTRLQARIYALAALLYFRENQPDVILVQIDMLRYQPVTVEFTPEECVVDIWRFLRNELQRILDIDDRKNLPRTVGPGCRYCPISARCKELRKHVDHGGVGSLSLEETVALRVLLEQKTAGEKDLIKQLDEVIVSEAAELDLDELAAGDHLVTLKVGSRRIVNQRALIYAIGFERYLLEPKIPVPVAAVEAMLKSDELDEETKLKVRAAVTLTQSEDLKVEVLVNGEKEGGL